MLRALIPLLITVLTLVASTALLLTATAITSPVTEVPVPPSPRSSVVRPASTPTPITESPVRTTLLVRTGRIVYPPPPVVVDLARLIYAPGSAGMSQGLPGLLLLAIEAGTLTVELDGTGEVLMANRPPQRGLGQYTLDAGDALVLPAAAAVAFRNAGHQPVVALAAGVFPAAVAQGATTIGPPQRDPAPARWIAAAAPGAMAQPLAGGWLVNTPAGPETVVVHRLVVQPRGAVPLPTSDVAIVAVEAGTLTLAVQQALVWRQSSNGPDEWIPPASDAVLLTGDGALLQDRPQSTLRNDGSGPLLILVLTVSPAVKGTIPPTDLT